MKEDKNTTVVVAKDDNDVFLIGEENYLNLAVDDLHGLLTRVPLSMSRHINIFSYLTKVVILVMLRWEIKFRAKSLVLVTST